MWRHFCLSFYRSTLSVDSKNLRSKLHGKGAVLTRLPILCGKANCAYMIAGDNVATWWDLVSQISLNILNGTCSSKLDRFITRKIKSMLLTHLRIPFPQALCCIFEELIFAWSTDVSVSKKTLQCWNRMWKSYVATGKVVINFAIWTPVCDVR